MMDYPSTGTVHTRAYPELLMISTEPGQCNAEMC
jgi:hypothetical protein